MKLSESQIVYLLETLCIDLGFCLPPDVRKTLISSPPGTVDEFTQAVFLGEGLDPALADRNTYREVRGMIAAAFEKAFHS
jgi:hypothetical protein